MRGSADVYVWAGRRTRDGAAEGDKRYPCALQVSHQRLAFDAVRVQPDINRITMIVSPAIVQVGLAEGADR